MSESAPPVQVSIAEYRLSTHGCPVLAMMDSLAAAMQRAGLTTRDQVVAALTTAVDLAAPSPTGIDDTTPAPAGQTTLLETAIPLSDTWRELWLLWSHEIGGYVAVLRGRWAVAS